MDLGWRGQETLDMHKLIRQRESRRDLVVMKVVENGVGRDMKRGIERREQGRAW